MFALLISLLCIISILSICGIFVYKFVISKEHLGGLCHEVRVVVVLLLNILLFPLPGQFLVSYWFNWPGLENRD
jgi:hypothetical protein